MANEESQTIEYRSPPKPPKGWMEGTAELLKMPLPNSMDELRAAGFRAGKQILGLYIIEMALKYALDESGSPEYTKIGHPLHKLFEELPDRKRDAVREKYIEILHCEEKETWDIAKSVDAFLQYLGNNPLTEARYFWEVKCFKVDGFVMIPDDIRRLAFAMLIALHNCPYPPLSKRYDTVFKSLEEVKNEAKRSMSTSRKEKTTLGLQRDRAL